MGEIFSQLISNTENVDYFLGLDITLNNQVEIWAWMSLSSVAVVYIAHLSAALRAAFIALFGSEKSNNHNVYYQKQQEVNKSFIKRLRNLTISMVILLPVICTIVRALPIFVSSLIVTQVFIQAHVRITRASIISIGLAQGILDSYSSIGKEISSLSNEVKDL